jgi:hypothetical protein
MFPVSLMVWGSVYRVVAVFGSVWWCIVLCTCCWFFFVFVLGVQAGVGSLCAVTAVGPTVCCPVIDGTTLHLGA